ncbi:hypothetical protein GCM10010441_20930 [Kitasatospora paracochleata]|uniref:Uncharacterized protein n=1 Tax=Kitasatospora paracochleata TaxID=58354 RepID=A0ABT1J906_9ACTN|nr:hypothetical protein [Kitasatospora paracochleata]MCP2313531.1 hypothetical protein [Kitasatospora paracochleata]
MLPALRESGSYARDTEAGGAVVVAPGDSLGTAPMVERRGGYCLGLDGGNPFTSPR